MEKITKKHPSFWDDLLLSMRPKHWLKNILVFTAIVFAHKMGEPMAVAKSIVVFVAFCFLSSANYLLNDVLDRNNDIYHFFKKRRPITQGRISIKIALFFWFILSVFALVVIYFIGQWLLYSALAFIIIGISYSLWLKHVVIVDAFAIAAGYLIRTMAGALAIEVPISSWLLICTLLLSLFMGITTRSLEMKLLAENASNHRPILAHYNPYLLDQMAAAITSAIVITYTLYTLSGANPHAQNQSGLFLTVPVVLYGIFRYLYLLQQKEVTGTLEGAIVTDKPMMIAVLIYAVIAFGVIYF